MLKETNTPTWPRIEPGSPDPESDALTIRPVRPPEGLYYLGSENKGPDQLHKVALQPIYAIVFAYAKGRFSDVGAQVHCTV